VHPIVVALAAVLAALCAAALTSWLRRLAGTDSPWFRSRLHVGLAGLGGAGAALIADDWAELAAYAALAVGCALLVVIDLTTLRLPNVLVGPLYPVILVLLTVSAASSGGWARLGRASAAGGILFAVYFALALIRPSGLGLGDVKLAGLLGMFLGWLGWSTLLAGSAAGFLLAGLVAATLVVIRRADRRTEFPFGPWMVLGTVVGATSTAVGSAVLLP